MNKFRHMMQRYMKPVGEDGSAGADRGDDFIPVAENEEEAAELARQQAAAADSKVEQTPEELEAERAKLGIGAGAKTDAEKAAEALAATEAGKTTATEEGVDGKGKAKDTRIPLARHTEILARERAAREAVEVQLANAQKGAQVAQTNEKISELEAKVVTLEEQYNAALVEGNTKEATALMGQIRSTERTITEQKSEFRVQAATALAVEQVRFDATIERLEAAYPQIVPGSETFDQDLVAQIVELREAYELKGYASSAALQKAVGILIPATSRKQEAATTVVPRVTEDEAAKAARELRETEQRKKNVTAANAQPPAVAAVGANSDEAGGKLDAKQAIKMPFDKFKNLTEEDLSRMRGDTL